MFCRLIFNLVECYENKSNSQQGHNQILDLDLIRDYIEQNLTKTLYIDELAGLCNLSTSYFKKKFRQGFGITHLSIFRYKG